MALTLPRLPPGRTTQSGTSDARTHTWRYDVQGRLTGELRGADATQEAIMTLATQRESVAEAVSA